MVNGLVEILGKLAAVAPIIIAVIAGGALWVGVTQLRQNRLNHTESVAKDIYKEYLKVAIQYPSLAYPENKFHKFIKEVGDVEELNRYAWFVSYALFACDEVLTLSRDRERWALVIKEQLRYHAEYLSWPEFSKTSEIEGYGPELQELIHEVRTEHSRRTSATQKATS